MLSKEGDKKTNAASYIKMRPAYPSRQYTILHTDCDYAS